MSYSLPDPPQKVPADIASKLDEQSPERLRQVARFAEELAEHREREARLAENEEDQGVKERPEDLPDDVPSKATITVKEVNNTQNTQNVAALKRARDQDLAVHPGQDIEYVVVDDEKTSRDRVALAHEEIETYDASYYETELVRAVESILPPLAGIGMIFDGSPTEYV